MKPFAAFVLLGALSKLGTASVIPAELVPRNDDVEGSGTEDDPFIVTADCTGCEPVCNADCYSILCLGAPNPVQRAENMNADNRKASGEETARKAFKEDKSKRERRGIFISDDVLNNRNLGRSPEESIMANTAQGGAGEIMYPVEQHQNSRKYMNSAVHKE
jgi:hypothetical protein